MEKEGKITIQYNHKGEVIWVKCDDGRELTKPTGNLARNPPPGVLISTYSLGEILRFKQPDGKEMIRCHIPGVCKYW